MPDSPEVLDALRDVIVARGWVLVAADDQQEIHLRRRDRLGGLLHEYKLAA